MMPTMPGSTPSLQDLIAQLGPSASIGAPPPLPAAPAVAMAPSRPMAPLSMPSLPQQAPAESPMARTLKSLIPMLFAGIAAKQGGPLAAAGALKGFTDGQIRKQAEARQQAEDAARNAATQEERDYRLATAARAERAQAVNFQQDSLAQLEKFTNPADRAAYITRAEQTGSDLFNLPKGWLSGMPAPDTHEKDVKEVQGLLDDIEKTHKGHSLDDLAAANFTVPFHGKQTSIRDLQTLAQIALSGPDGKPATLSQKAGPDDRTDLVEGTGEFQTRAKAKLRVKQQALGRRLTDQEAEGVIDGVAKDVPRNPMLDALTGAQLNQMRTGDLPPQVQSRVQTVGDSFRNEQVVKETQTQAQAYDFVKNLPANSKSPADDIGLIYAFAKAMDPNSVVREGEYSTVQKYAQSWLSSFGFSAERVLNNSEFLTPDARAKLKETIRKKYLAGRRQYDNVAAQYGKRINQITGLTDGQQRIVDYSAAFPDAGDQSGGQKMRKEIPGHPGQFAVSTDGGKSWKAE